MSLSERKGILTYEARGRLWLMHKRPRRHVSSKPRTTRYFAVKTNCGCNIQVVNFPNLLGSLWYFASLLSTNDTEPSFCTLPSSWRYSFFREQNSSYPLHLLYIVACGWVYCHDSVALGIFNLPNGSRCFLILNIINRVFSWESCQRVRVEQMFLDLFFEKY